MNDPRHARRHESNAPLTLMGHYLNAGGAAPLVVLVIVLAAEIGASFYGATASQLDREGVMAQATVLSIEQEVEVQRRPGQIGEIEIVHTYIDYEFQTKAGEIVQDQSKSQNLSQIPDVGSFFTVRYARSDPSVHETRVGHFQSNTDALHWISLFFAGVSLLCVAVFFKIAVRNYRRPEERRHRAEASQA
ncbi:DUF3592 domain-containing protein [Neorhodopirellula lusitana]|nr:DUF3592 domain-containing protein [Neorhodopirellula lusitana]